ncbi:hypothetical protein [Chelativorans salis]|uniref:Uncharacterized protein n=1 Tax=Chelativorans salis TaxID=2978478 RepID=A0ABT2LJB1_9HYPH|nr:hypothetical protein [Chelativorans sp. EGI FJ00035]MCT7374640.1 hypothetical protein [Chelativorans sp. EGI FJ00035]
MTMMPIDTIAIPTAIQPAGSASFETATLGSGTIAAAAMAVK